MRAALLLLLCAFVPEVVGFKKWRSQYHLEKPRADKKPQQELDQATWFDPNLESFVSREMPYKEYGLTTTPVEGYRDIWIAHRKHHLIWQIRDGRVFKIFGNKNDEAGLRDGDIDAELSMTALDNSNGGPPMVRGYL